MMKLFCLVRRTLIHRQLRSLEDQADSIIEARRHSLVRLMDIQRNCVSKQAQLRRYTRQLSAPDTW